MDGCQSRRTPFSLNMTSMRQKPSLTLDKIYTRLMMPCPVCWRRSVTWVYGTKRRPTTRKKTATNSCARSLRMVSETSTPIPANSVDAAGRHGVGITGGARKYIHDDSYEDYLRPAKDHNSLVSVSLISNEELAQHNAFVHQCIRRNERKVECKPRNHD